MIGEKQPNCVHRMNRSAGETGEKFVFWYPPTSWPQIENPLIAADKPGDDHAWQSILVPKLGSLSPAQQPGNAWVPVNPLRAKRTPSLPRTPWTVL